MNPFSLAVDDTIGVISAALDLLSVDVNSALSLQLSGTTTENDAVDVYESNLAAITSLVQAQKIASIPAGDDDDSRAPVGVGGTRARYLYVVRTAGSTAGLSLIVQGQVSGGGTSSTAWTQGGNSFDATGVIGTNDLNPLQVRSNGTTRIALSALGQVDITAAGGQSINLIGPGGVLISATNGFGVNSGTIASISADGNVTIRAGGTLTLVVNGVTYTWPAADGAAGQKLTTNGSGSLSWS